MKKKLQFSKRSQDNLEGVHPSLQIIVSEALNMGLMDFSVVEGLRTPERQKQLVADNKSKTMNSKHLKQADGYGHAVDLYPWPVNMAAVHKGDAREIARFGFLAGMIMAIADKHGVAIRWGADWDSDGETLDHTFFDAPHFELVS